MAFFATIYVRFGTYLLRLRRRSLVFLLVEQSFIQLLFFSQLLLCHIILEVVCFDRHGMAVGSSCFNSNSIARRNDFFNHFELASKNKRTCNNRYLQSSFFSVETYFPSLSVLIRMNITANSYFADVFKKPREFVRLSQICNKYLELPN